MKSFSEWLKFNEMPLSHYGYQFKSDNDPDEKYNPKTGSQAIVTADPEYPGEFKINSIKDRFSRRDKIIISRPLTAKLVEEKLRKSKFNFNILFIELDPNWRDSQEKKSDELWGVPVGSTQTSRDIWQSDVNKYIKLNNIKIDNHITFVKNASTGHLLKPWMIFHTLGHALSDFVGGEFMMEMHRVFRRIVSNIDKYELQKLRDKNFIMPTYAGNAFSITRAIIVFDFKSIRDESINDSAELRHELVAEYLWNGKIRINKAFEDSKEIVEEVKNLEFVLSNMLQKCVGKIIYDDTIKISV